MSSPNFEYGLFFELESGDTRMNFTFSKESDGTVRGEYVSGNGINDPGNPPKLSRVMALIAEGLNIGDCLPAETNFDADVQAVVFKVQNKDKNRSVEIAAAFQLLFNGQPWDLNFIYTNNTAYGPDAGKSSDSGPGPYVFGLSFCGLIDLSRLPLVGKIPGIDQLRLDKLGFYYTKASFGAEGKELHFSIPQLMNGNELVPSANAMLTQSGFSLMTIYGNPEGTTSQSSSGTTGQSPSAGGTMAIPVATGQTQPGATDPFAAGPAAPQDPLKWLPVNKTFGPVSLEKIGIGYDKPQHPDELGVLSVYLDGSFQIAGFGMALDRLGLSFTIPKPDKFTLPFNPLDRLEFHLGGLFVDYQAPGLTIAGGFETLPGKGTNFIGEFLIGAGGYNLQAYGGFSDELADPSLFIFLHLNTPLGGPPFFSIKGISGGFGVNRAFNLPTFDELVDYPLLPSVSSVPTAASLTGKPEEKLAKMTAALTSLSRYLPPKQGEYWLALGLDVSSFEMIQVSAVLAVAFGVDLRVGLVGTAAMTLPVHEAEPIVYLEVDFACTFSSSDGLLATMGQITPASFIYGKFVHLTGGFAFYTWLSGPDKGDFVMTIGGYHPRYQKPALYPDVPRMKMNFALGGLNFTGQSYFALTPQAMMAGIDIHATWSSGPLEAWFDMGMDFLINWKPFHYEADGYINIGISLDISLLFVTIRITVYAGVDMQVWGPPFGGRAVVDLDIVSFTIDFGESATKPVVDWKEFRSFLQGGSQPDNALLRRANTAGDAPTRNDNKPLVDISVAGGLLRHFEGSVNARGLDWLIDAAGFEIVTQSAAPCTDAVFNTTDVGALTESKYVQLSTLENATTSPTDSLPVFAYTDTADLAWNTLPIGIVSMNLRNIHSTHKVSLVWDKEDGSTPAETNNLLVVLQTQRVPAALWGNGGATTVPALSTADALIDHALGGFSIRPPLSFPVRTTMIPYYYLVFETNDLFLEQDTLPGFKTAGFSDADKTAYVSQMRSGSLFSATAVSRKSVVDSLQQNGYPAMELQNDQLLNTGQYLGDPLFTCMNPAS